MGDIYDSIDDNHLNFLDEKIKRREELKKSIKKKYPEVLALLEEFYKETWM